MKRILIVEDDPFLSKAYHTLLQREGFEVETASDGLEGVNIAEEGQYDLILLDMLMPELSGLEFLKVYDQPTKHHETKIIAFSNMSTPETIEDTRKWGAVRYLTKATLSPRDMVGIIREVLAERSPSNA